MVLLDPTPLIVKLWGIFPSFLNVILRGFFALATIVEGLNEKSVPTTSISLTASWRFPVLEVGAGDGAFELILLFIWFPKRRYPPIATRIIKTTATKIEFLFINSSKSHFLVLSQVTSTKFMENCKKLPVIIVKNKCVNQY